MGAEQEVRAAQQVELHAQPSTDAPALARRAIDNACDVWDLDHLRTPALLIISELVTNAVRHGKGQIDIEAVFRGDFLHLGVHDGSPEPPAPVPPKDGPTLPESGRGLHIVAAYSSAWGYIVKPSGKGKMVWATLRVRPAGS